MTERRRPPRRGRGQRPPNRTSAAETVDEPNPYREDSTDGAPSTTEDVARPNEDVSPPAFESSNQPAGQPEFNPPTPPPTPPPSSPTASPSSAQPVSSQPVSEERERSPEAS